MNLQVKNIIENVCQEYNVDFIESLMIEKIKITKRLLLIDQILESN